MLDYKRRTFLFLAPAIVLAPSLMKISSLHQRVPWAYYSRKRIVEYGVGKWWTIGAPCGLILASRWEVERYFWNLDVEYHRA